MDDTTNQLRPSNKIYNYNSPDIKSFFLLCLVFYFFIDSSYRLKKYGDLMLENDPKNLIKIPFRKLVISVIVYLLNQLGLEKPSSFDIVINVVTEIFIIFVVGSFLLLIIAMLSNKQIRNHTRSVFKLFGLFSSTHVQGFCVIFIL